MKLPRVYGPYLQKVGQMSDDEVAQLAYAGICMAPVGPIHPKYGAAIRVAYARAGGWDGTIYDKRLDRWVMDRVRPQRPPRETR